MKTFHLNRIKDVSGISGTGIVANGVEFNDGKCVISWFGPIHSIEIFNSIHEIDAIHGHKGATLVVYDKE